MESKLSADELCEAFRAFIKNRGGRFTPERKAIVEGILQVGKHFVIEDLIAVLEKQRFRVSMATIYNTINELLAASFLVKYNIQDKSFYELGYMQPKHSHQICTMCGRISEFQNPDLDEAVRGQKYKRFTLADYSLMVYGICSVCKGQLKRANRKNII